MRSTATELFAARPVPDPLLWPEEECERGWPPLVAPAADGFPSPADDFVERCPSLDERLIRNPESTFLMRARGDALRGLGVCDGDLLVVDRGAPPTAGSLVVTMVEGTPVLRRLSRDIDGRLALEPTPGHSAGRPALAGECGTELWGVVRWAVHRLWPARESHP